MGFVRFHVRPEEYNECGGHDDGHHDLCLWRGMNIYQFEFL